MTTLTQTPALGALLAHLHSNNTPISLRRSGWLGWDDTEIHTAAFADAPAQYALLAVADTTAHWQRVRMLYQILRPSRTGMAHETRATLDRVAAFLCTILPADQVIMVFLALRQARANHKHVSRVILRYILNHPYLDDMARHRRPALADCLEHALGKNVARGSARLLTLPEVAPYAQRAMLRFAQTPERVQATVPYLYHRGDLVGEATESYTQAHMPFAAIVARAQERPQSVTATNRGDIAATLVHLYRGGSSVMLEQEVERQIEAVAGTLPRYDGRLALVFDASASTRSYGEREFCSLAQSVALRQVMARICPNLTVYPVGAPEQMPAAAGATDLAEAVLKALADGPDIVAIISDGYENVYAGDLARVTASLPGAGITTPVVFCHSMYSYADDLSLRRPAPALPEIRFWHQNDFGAVLLQMYAQAQGTNGIAAIETFLHDTLTRYEKEMDAWITF